MTYLVAFIILTRFLLVQGILEWKVIKTITDYGQNVTLFCNVSNCCPQFAGWNKYTPNETIILIDVKTWTPSKKYDGKVLKDGYTLVIQNLTNEDLNVSYACVYGSIFGDQRTLLEENVFNYGDVVKKITRTSLAKLQYEISENISTTQQNSPVDDTTFSAGKIAGIILGVSALVLFGIVIVCFWKRRKKRPKNFRISIKDSDEEVPLITPFLEEPNDIHCIEGEDAILTCKLRQNIPTLKWLKNGKEITQIERCIMSTVDTQHTLTIQNTTESDSGDYYVQVGKFSKKIQLNITDPFLEEPIDIKCIEGEDAILTCKLRPNMPTLKWLRNGKEISQIERCFMSTVDTQHTLTIKNTTESDSGDYYVQVGKFSKKIQLNITDPFLEEPIDIQCIEGEDAILTCKLRPNMPTLKWLRNGKEISQIERCFMSTVDTQHTLTIKNTTESDSGDYYVQVGKFSKKIQLNITDPFLEEPIDIQCIEGEDAILTCKLRPNMPTLKWLRNGKEISQIERCFMSTVDTQHTLTIKNTTESDSGDYYVQVGKFSKKIQLNITDPFLEEPIDSQCIEGEDAILTCKLRPNMPTLKWLRNGKEISQIERCFMSTVDTQHTLTIKNTTESDSGDYYVQVGKFSKKIQLNITDPFLEEPIDSQCIEGEDAILTCKLRPNMPTLKWLRNGKEISQIERCFMSTVDTQHTLTIKNTTESDSGDYYVQVGKFSKKIQLNITDPFLEEPIDSQCIEGEDAILTCKLRPNMPTLKWLRNGKEISQIERCFMSTVDTQHTLTIKNTTESDSGDYYVQVGKFSKKIQLNITDPFLEEPIDSQCIEGEDAILTCKLRPNMPTLKWLRNGKEISQIERCFMSTVDTQHTLTIKNTTESDSGDYYVQVGKFSKKIQLNITDPFLEEPIDSQCIEGEDAILTCKLRPNMPTLKWLRNGKEISQIERCFMSTVDTQHTLTIKNTTESDSGDYYVQVGKFSKKIQLNITDPFLEEPIDSQCIEGEDAILTCKLRPNMPTLKWLRNGKEISQIERCFMSTVDTQHTLTIKNTTESDSGDYYVQVGKFSKKIQLNITELQMEISKDERNTYMEAIESGIEIRQYVRVQVIGKDRVGKTSLVRRLLYLEDGKYDGKSTDGIEINRKCQIRKYDGAWFVGEVDTQKKEMMRRIGLAVDSKQAKTVTHLVEDTETTQNKQINREIASTKDIFQETENKLTDQEPLLSRQKNMETETLNIVPTIYDDTTYAGNTPAVTTNNEDENELSKYDKMMSQTHIDLKNPESTDNHGITADQITDLMIKKMDEIISSSKMDKEKKESGDLVECGIWDFAGQKDYYATHQTFFTPYAIYLLVVDIEDDIKPITHDEDDCTCIGDYVDFWFDSVHCFCKDHSAEKLSPPVIMVCTGTDKFEKCNGVRCMVLQCMAYGVRGMVYEEWCDCVTCDQEWCE
ncbi:obscurin-like [Mytilus trossulus]|uniref:obscurin-like n=1 Tax=Mytilus trossulus TaxID=6551 RepID=UPI003007F0D5